MALYVLMALVGIGWRAVVSLRLRRMIEKVDKSRIGFFMGLFNLSVVLPQLVSTRVGYVLKTAPDQAVLPDICGGRLAVSAALWCWVSDAKVGGVVAVPAAAH